jgi:hypothetical protein
MQVRKVIPFVLDLCVYFKSSSIVVFMFHRCAKCECNLTSDYRLLNAWL